MRKILWYNFLNFLFLLLVVECSFKLFQPDYQYYERTYAAKFSEKAIHHLDTNWVKSEPDLGWVCKQKTDLKFYLPAFYSIQYQINAQGFRMQQELERGEAVDCKRILLLGDSFVFGIFLAENKTISSRLQNQLGNEYEIYNLAIPGWGIDQMYQAYQKYVAQIQPHQVVLIFIDDDLLRTIEAFFWGTRTKRAYKLIDGKLAFRTPTDGYLNLIESWFVFNFQIVNRLYHFWHQQEAIQLSKIILGELILAERNANRELISIRLPRREQVKLNRVKRFDLADFFEKKKGTYGDLNDKIKSLSVEEINMLYLSKDGHLSEKGAAKVVDCLLEF